MNAHLFLAAALLAGFASLPTRAQDAPPALISTVQRENDWFCSVSAPRAPLGAIVDQLARSMHMEVEGRERISPTALVTVELRDRPLDQALEWMLGASNLRASWRTGVIQIRELVPTPPTSDELRELALNAYSGALRSFPDPEAGAAAAFAKASIFEQRGEIAQAIAGYDSLARAFPEAIQAPEALLRSARMLVARGDFAGAGNHYADLLRLSAVGPFEAEARLGFAQCLARQGDSRTALRLCVALDNSNPATTRLELHQRHLLRARCLLGEGDPAGARKFLKEAENGGLEPELEAEYHEIYARALPGDAAAEDAARAWMEHAKRAQGTTRLEALAEAMRWTRMAGDELGALWIDRWAQKNGAGEATRLEAQGAREALGLDGRSLSSDPSEERLARGERLMRARLWSEGSAAFLAMREEALPEDEAARVRLYVGLSACLDGDGRVDDAIAMLREALELVKGPEHRKQLFLAAAAIFEAHERLDDAIEAYRGRL